MLDLEELYIYMLAIASQTAGLNWLTFFEETRGHPGGTQAKKLNFLKSNLFATFFSSLNFDFLTIPRATTGSSASYLHFRNTFYGSFDF